MTRWWRMTWRSSLCGIRSRRDGALRRASAQGHSHLEGATIAGGAIIGPLPGCVRALESAKAAHIGNFVEVKNTVIGAGAKAIISPIWAMPVWGRMPISAPAPITCNYDGFTSR